MLEKPRFFKRAAGAPESFSVMIVDQDIMVQDLVGRTVTNMGHRAIPVPDFDHARSSCLNHMPDLIIVDLYVSETSGIEFCRWIKGQEGGELVPILVLTELKETNDKTAALKCKVEALEEVANDFITKPFMFQELKARLGSLLRNRSLSLKLVEQNRLLKEAQQKIVTQERQLCATQLAGAAAHTLGQPLTAIKLNCHLLETLPVNDSRHTMALQAVKGNVNRLVDIIQGLEKVDAAKTESYHSGVKILEVKE